MDPEGQNDRPIAMNRPLITSGFYCATKPTWRGVGARSVRGVGEIEAGTYFFSSGLPSCPGGERVLRAAESRLLQGTHTCMCGGAMSPRSWDFLIV